MTTPSPQKGRRGAAALIAVLATAIVLVVVAGVVSAASAPGPAGSPAAAGPTPSAVPSTTQPAPVQTARPTSSPTSTPKTKKKATVVPAASPQPTKTATISKPTVIVKAFTAKVTKMEAVTGKADGPGEIGGPSVRFTITISNSTGRAVNLSNTVVNAYYGKDASPAVELRMPGGRSFPASIGSGKTATGVFVFNIPVASRSLVEVTVDTSVKNPVVAFKGDAPK